VFSRGFCPRRTRCNILSRPFPPGGQTHIFFPGVIAENGMRN
jgi:hypothetical protein